MIPDENGCQGMPAGQRRLLAIHWGCAEEPVEPVAARQTSLEELL